MCFIFTSQILLKKIFNKDLHLLHIKSHLNKYNCLSIVEFKKINR